jgi:hypothetical protein
VKVRSFVCTICGGRGIISRLIVVVVVIVFALSVIIVTTLVVAFGWSNMCCGSGFDVSGVLCMSHRSCAFSKSAWES